MSDIVELSNGYVFAKSSVRAITAITLPIGNAVCNSFHVIGVGYKVKIYSKDRPTLADAAEFEDLHREAIEKLLKDDTNA